MSITSLLIIVLLIFSVTLLSGLKIMINCKYIQTIMFFFIIYGPFSELVEVCKSGYTYDALSIIILIIVLLLIFIWGYRRNKYIYSLHNLKQKDVVDIIERYLERRDIKYEIRGNEIQLTELYKVIYVKGQIEVLLDCRQIKDMELYNDILMEVRTKIKDIKKRYFRKEAIIYLILAGILYWVKIKFFS